ncbi:YciE/YciF ferroxidase family protein [Flavobacterium foetidum]|uniref:YciE/YciF ferroxidase family protein n=1 Tax=Flavobacterium foetidum TaxID=2026681 RepID=UPI001074E484|nr:DUF892 family protein [Flavobacterium foetidum]KAF2510570.1 DUF892 family protein [Flavobacterium foetidum]
MKRSRLIPKVRKGAKVYGIFEKLWMMQLRELLSSERQSMQTLPKIVQKVSSPNLKDVLKGYIEITRQQIIRLEQIFALRDTPARGRKGIASSGLLKEVLSVSANTISGPVWDAGTIAAVQKIIHYQIAAYHTLMSWSRTLSEERIAEMLAVASCEEKEADRLLTEAAHTTINFDAAIDENKKIATEHYNPKL